MSSDGYSLGEYWRKNTRMEKSTTTPLSIATKLQTGKYEPDIIPGENFIRFKEINQIHDQIIKRLVQLNLIFTLPNGRNS